LFSTAFTDYDVGEYVTSGQEIPQQTIMAAFFNMTLRSDRVYMLLKRKTSGLTITLLKHQKIRVSEL
jgi:hypothetical protein